MDINYNSDVIVIGAGPCGIAAALEVARGGKKVVLIEKGEHPGSKNMYGGAVYDSALREVFGNEVDYLPYERIINSHTWSFLNDTGSFDMTYKNSSSRHAYAIKRFNLEKWMVEIAKKNGVYYIPNTLVEDLIIKDGYVTGIKTSLEEYYAPVSIIADGVNSLLARKLNLRDDFKPYDMILSAKETIKLDKKVIESRFNLSEDNSNGVCKMYFGGLKEYKNIFMMSFLYTFKDTIMLGVGANLADLSKNKLNINKIIDEIKSHPDIIPLIEGGKTIEYSAHLIPETGFNKMPELVAPGAILAGDAAGFINSVHFEGTNYALISGKLAGEAALCALNNNDFSVNTLSVYKKKLSKSFILKDLYTYRNIIHKLYSRSNSLSYYYPYKIKEFFEIVTSANCYSKSSQFKKFLFNFIKDRSLSELIKDIKAFLRCAFDMLSGK